ncbi:MAG: beta-ketoacyl synthase chain length factor [Breznakibacter sp.]
MFIVDLLAISPQDTYHDPDYLKNIRRHSGNKYWAVEPNYLDIIKPSQLRRMGKALRMGLGCGVPLLKKYGQVDGIIIGTSEGGLEGCINFLNQIVDYDEGTLTPTNFIQSTPNAVSGHLALITGNTNYNITHVNQGLAFEDALIDAFMLFAEGKTSKVLVGNVEEISDYNYNINWSAGQYKKDPCDSDQLLRSGTEGAVAGEGSVMFILDNGPQAGGIQIKDVATTTLPDLHELKTMCLAFLKGNGLTPGMVDGLIVGMNGDSRTDTWYDQVMDQVFPGASVFSYKQLTGEYPTSSAFAVKLGHDLMCGNSIPSEIMVRDQNRELGHVLIYNHYNGIQHSFILLSKVVSVRHDPSP